MLFRTDLPTIPLRGPAPSLLGATASLLRFFADPVGAMLALARTHGDLAAVVDGNAALVCAFGAEHYRAVITQPTAFAHFSEVPIRVRPDTAFARLNNTIVLMNDDAHRTRRRLLMPALSKAAVEGYAPQMVAVASEAVARWPVGETVDVAPLVRSLTASIALRCLFGLDEQDDLEELGRMEVELLSTIASPLSMLLPYALPGTPYRKGLQLAERIEARVLRLVAEKRQRPSTGDALSRLIASRDDDGAALADADLVAESNSLFAAAFDTSAHTLAWTLLLLAEHPAICDELRDELATVLAGRPPRLDDLPSLVRLDRVVKESMRLFPVAILLFLRVVAREVALGGVTLPAGAQLLLGPLVTHRDPALFPSPNRFDPARWATLDPPPYTYLPFGAGARTCIGAAFATASLRLTLARVLQSLRPVVPRGAKIDYAVRGPAMGPRGGLRLELRPADAPGEKRRPRGTVNQLVDLT